MQGAYHDYPPRIILPRGRLYLVDTSSHHEMPVLNYISAYAAYFIYWERPRCPLRVAMRFHIDLS